MYQYSFLESTQGKSKDSDIVDCCACIPSIHIPASWSLELFSSFFSLMVFFQLSESNDLQRDFNWGRGTVAISWHGRHKLLKAPCTCFAAVSCRVQGWFQRHLLCPMWHFWLMLSCHSVFIDFWFTVVKSGSGTWPNSCFNLSTRLSWPAQTVAVEKLFRFQRTKYVQSRPHTRSGWVVVLEDSDIFWIHWSPVLVCTRRQAKREINFLHLGPYRVTPSQNLFCFFFLSPALSSVGATCCAPVCCTPVEDVSVLVIWFVSSWKW